MNKTAIIIPSRLNAKRLPNKPLKLINNKEMILHVYEAAMKSNSGEVFVASPDEKIVDLVKKFGGKGILTKDNHETGTIKAVRSTAAIILFISKLSIILVNTT